MSKTSPRSSWRKKRKFVLNEDERTWNISHLCSWHQFEFAIPSVTPTNVDKELLCGKNWGYKENQWQTCLHWLYKLSNHQHTEIRVKQKHEQKIQKALRQKEQGSVSKGSSLQRRHVNWPKAQSSVLPTPKHFREWKDHEVKKGREGWS